MSGSTKARTNSPIVISTPTTPPSQDFKSFLYFYILFAAEVGFAVFLGGLMPDFQLSYNIAETGELVSFSFNLRELIEVILLGPVFCATAWKANNILVNNLDEEVRKQVRLNFWRALYVAYCAVVVIGATSHALANRLHGMLKDTAMASSALYHAVYFWDEILSHFLIPIGFFGALKVNAVLDSLENKDGINLLPKEKFAVLFMAIGLALTWTYSLLEGQAAWFYFFSFMLHVALVLFFRFMPKNSRQKIISGHWRMKVKNNPYVMLLLVMAITSIIAIVIWASITGVKPHFPFLYQPSEVF